MQIPLFHPVDTVILANGAFPEHEIPLTYLKTAQRVISCDGAVESLLKLNLEPGFIVGDLDSLSDPLKKHYASILYHDSDQETNDLTKAVRFSVSQGWNDICILGATGKREDHSLGNISLLAEYMRMANVRMYTDYGVFVPVSASADFESFPGQQVSIFSLTPQTHFRSESLKYPLSGMKFTSWWQGTLNESIDNVFRIILDQGDALVYRTYPGHN